MHLAGNSKLGTSRYLPRLAIFRLTWSVRPMTTCDLRCVLIPSKDLLPWSECVVRRPYRATVRSDVVEAAYIQLFPAITSQNDVPHCSSTVPDRRNADSLISAATDHRALLQTRDDTSTRCAWLRTSLLSSREPLVILDKYNLS